MIENRLQTCVLILAIAAAGCSKPGAPVPPVVGAPGKGYSVALILVDTLHPDHLGCYGYARPTSPFIDSLAREGVLFENARSASTFTGEAVASLFTGRPPAMGATGLGWSARPTPMDENLPKLFEAAGYRTGIFSTSFVMRFKGFYDSFQDAELFPGVPNSSALDERLADAALTHARQHQDAPTFQYLHFYAPHAPYNPPQAYLERFAPDRNLLDPEDELHPAALVAEGMRLDDPRLVEFKKHYDAEIAFIDDCIRRYLDGLRELGTLSNTVIILVSDHGEEFLEHGFADHAWNLHDETLRIPLIFWAPDLYQPARITDKVSIADVMPSLMRCLAIPHAPFVEPLAGQYLFAPAERHWTYAGREGAIVASLFPETRAQLHTVLFDQYKYIAGPRWLQGPEYGRFWLLQGELARLARAQSFKPLDPWARPEREAVYDLDADPGETNNLASERPELLEQGRALIDAYKSASEPHRVGAPATTMADPFQDAFIADIIKGLVEQAGTPESSGTVDGERIDPEVIQGLETMGYL